MTSRCSSNRAPFSRHRLLGGNEVAAVQDTSRPANTSRGKASAKVGSDLRPSQNQHRDEHERDPAFERESECARNAIEPSSPEFECVLIRRHLEEVIQSTGSLHFDGR